MSRRVKVDTEGGAIPEVVDSDEADRFDALIVEKCAEDAEFRRQWTHKAAKR